MPHIPNWPKDMLATLLFEELFDDKTKLTFLWEPRNPTTEELKVFKPAGQNTVRAGVQVWNILHSYLESL